MIASTRRSLLSLLAVAGLGAAFAASGQPSAVAAAPGACPDPIRGLCLKEGYLETPCGLKKAAMCKDAIAEALLAQHEAARAPERKMLRPGKTAIPQDVRVGKYRRYDGPKRTDELAKLGTNPMAQTKQSYAPGAPPTKLPLDAHRNAKWAANKGQVTSCDEYAYEKLYDWSRFIDASTACRGHDDCVVDVALQKKAPGLWQTMTSYDGKEKLWQPSLNKQAIAKNVFYSFGDKFVYSGDPQGVEKSGSLELLAQNLRNGAKHHYIGVKAPKPMPPRTGEVQTGTTKKGITVVDPNPEYANEFAFHDQMRKATKALSIPEQEEFARRRRLMQDLIELWVVASAAEVPGFTIDRPPEIGNAFELPFETQTMDPFDFLAHTGKQVGKLQAAAKKLGAKSLAGRPGAGWISQPVARKTTTGMRDLEDIDEALRGVLAAPRVRRTPPTTTTPSRGQSRVRRKPPARLSRDRGGPEGSTGVASTFPSVTGPIADPDDIPCTTAGSKQWIKPQKQSAGTYGVPLEAMGYGPISCRIGTLLRDEWQRSLAGERTCVTLDDSACDWDPEMFTTRFVDTSDYFAKYAALENKCEAWVAGELEKKAMPSHAAVDKRIEELMAELSKANEILLPYKQDGAKDLKTYAFAAGDDESWGDKSTFGSGYHTSLDWTVSGESKGGGHDVCSFSGSVGAELSAYGYLLGKKHHVVDALARGEVERRKARFQAHVLLLGMEQFPTEEMHSLSKAWDSGAVGTTKTLPSPKPTIHIQAGPVPISGSAWGEVMLAAQAKVDADVGGCDGGGFGIRGSVGPIALISAAAQVGAGISGIASVGIRGYLNLVTVGLPFSMNLQERASGVEFEGGLDLTLRTLSGRLSLYIEYLIGEDEFEIISWKGLGPETFAIFDIPEVTMPLVGFEQ